MTLVSGLILSLLMGFLLGLFFFGSLWITVRQLPTTQQPVRLVLGSLLGRLAIALLGFYLIMDGQWQRVLAALIGFVIARRVLVRRFQPRLTAIQSLQGE